VTPEPRDLEPALAEETPAPRDRIREAAMDLVLAHGYGTPTVEMVLDRAGADRADFDRHFADMEDCCLRVYLENIEAFDKAVFAAFARPGGWRDRIRAAVLAMERCLSDHARDVEFDVVAMSSAGDVPRVHRERQLQRLADLVDLGREELDDPDSVSRRVAESVVGSIYQLLVGELRAGRGGWAEEDLVPAAMYVALRPYLGHRVALEEFGKQKRTETTSPVQTSAVPRYRRSVSKRAASGEDSAPGLGRLPPGRHGLPREFVAGNQRGRLAAGIIAAVAEHGYHDTTITQIAAAAGVSRRTFYTYFSSKQECFFDAYEQIASHLHEAANAAAAPHAEWPDRVRARLQATLEVFAANPNLVRFYLAEPPRAGDEIAARYRATTARTLAELTADRPAPPACRSPSEAAEQAVMGGMATLIVRKVDAGEGSSLPELLSDLLELVLTPYLGRNEAVRMSRRVS
jgi:AcrR family transcriptional regulator